jgi:hypothetical protein
MSGGISSCVDFMTLRGPDKTDTCAVTCHHTRIPQGIDVLIATLIVLCHNRFGGRITSQLIFHLGALNFKSHVAIVHL